jgi:hypothetical protein
MALFTDAGTPSVLTGYAQEALNDAENKHTKHLQPENTFAQFAPNRQIENTVFEYDTKRSEGSGIADRRAYDAAVKLSEDVASESTKYAKLTPLSDMGRISEELQMETRGSLEERINAAVLRNTVNRTLSIANRIELDRVEALVDGKVTINSPGFKKVVNFGRHASAARTATVVWTDPTATPITDLLEAKKAYIAQTGGEEPGQFVMSGENKTLLYGSAEARAMLGDVPFALPAQVDALLVALELPPIKVNDFKVGKNKDIRVFPTDKVAVLPAGGATSDQEGNGVAATVWTRSAEALNPDYQLADVDDFGIVSAAYKLDGAAAIYVRSDAVALPVVMRPEYTMSLKVK